MSQIPADSRTVAAYVPNAPPGVWHLNLGCAQGSDTRVLRTLSDKDINCALLCLDVWAGR